MKRCDSFHWHLQYSHNRFEGSCGNFAKGRAQEKPRKTPLSSMAQKIKICSKNNNNNMLAE